MHRIRAQVTGIVSPRKSGHMNSRGRLVPVASQLGLGNLEVQNRLTSHSPYSTSTPGDLREREAERTADRVMSGASTRSLTAAPTGGTQCKGHDACSTTSTGHAPAMTGAGRALPASARQFFEPRFGRDLGQVRIHDDAAAQQTARQLNARAFTQRNHIGFDADQYAPDSREGRHLLAHELAHVQQQDGSDTIYRESWNVDDGGREIERQLLVQLIFEDTWSDMWDGTGWTPARKSTFRSNFVSSIENTFNNSGFLITAPPSYGDVLPRENIAQGYKPLVDITLVPEGETSVSEDWEVDVSSNPTSEFRTSSSSTSYGTLDEADNTPVTKMGADPGVTQVPTVHEFGHFIGLDHPGEGLEGSWISDSELSPGADAYSHTGTDAEGRTVHGPSDLMGSGMGLRPFYFDAWAQALDEHVDELRRAEQMRQFQRDWNMFGRALNNDPAGVDWFMRGIAGR